LFHFWKTISVSNNAKGQPLLIGNMVVVLVLIRDVSREYHTINRSIFSDFYQKKKKEKVLLKRKLLPKFTESFLPVNR
jgi:hypothetical protein